MIPSFASPALEAAWFQQHRKELEDEISRRLASGDTMTLADALAQSAHREKAKLRPVTLRMQTEDLRTARRLAAEKGLPYQTYIKVLLRAALRRESRKST